MPTLRLPFPKPRGGSHGRVPDFAVAEVGLVPVDVQPARFLFGAGEGLAHGFCDEGWDTQFPGVGGLPAGELREVGLVVGVAAEVVARCLQGRLGRTGFAILWAPLILFLDRASCSSGGGGLVVDACAAPQIFGKFSHVLPVRPSAEYKIDQ